MLVTCSGNVILVDTLRRIREELGIPIVNQWLDCKQTFVGGMGSSGQDVGQKHIASEFDLVWTSSRSTCEWYMVEGGRPLYLPEGFSPILTPHLPLEKFFDVGFLGSRYGLRQDYIDLLRRAGLTVDARGYGWPSPPLAIDEMGTFFGNCKVNLGLGGVGYSMELTTIKGRDFEVPGAGCCYLTTYNPDLAAFFDIGKEIACFRTPQEMVEMAIDLVNDPGRRAEMAVLAHSRSLREHRWLHRFQEVLSVLGLIDDIATDGACEERTGA